MIWLDGDETIAEGLDFGAETYSDPISAVREAMDILNDQDIVSKRRPVILYGTSRHQGGDMTIFEAIQRHTRLH